MDSDQQSPKSDLEQLMDDLEAVRERGIDRIDDASGSLQKSVPALILRRYAADYASRKGITTDRPGQARLLLCAALPQIGDATLRRRAELLYGLHLHHEQSLPADLIDAVREQFNESRSQKKTTQRNNARARRALAQTIIAVHRAEIEHDIHERSEPLHYVRRERYHVRFRELVRGGEKLVVLVGAPGNGKRHLATELVREVHGKDDGVFVIRAETRDWLLNNLAAVLGSLKYEIGLAPADTLVRAFIGEMAKPGKLKFVIIVDLAESISLAELVPLTTQATVVVTAQVNPLPRGRGSVIEVETMTNKEALELIRRLLPAITPSEAGELRTVLANHPLAIAHACDFIGNDSLINVSGYCQRIKSDVANGLAVPLPPGQQPLTSIYKQLFAKLRITHSDAATLLEIIVYTYGGAPYELLRDCFKAVESVRDESEVRIRVDKAIRSLGARYLLKVTDRGIVVHHALAYGLLRSILRDKRRTLCLALHNIISHKLSHVPPKGVLNFSEFDWARQLISVIHGLFGDGHSGLDPEVIIRSISIAERAHQQIGLAEEGQRLLLHYAQISPNILQRDDSVGVEANKLWTEHRYNLAYSTRGEYVSSRENIQMLEYHDLSKTPPKVHSLTDMIRTLALGYNFRSINELTEIAVREIHNKATPDTAAETGDLLTSCAEALAMQARWDEAYVMFQRALDVYSLNFDDLNCLHGELAVHLEWANAAIDAGATDAADLVNKAASLLGEYNVLAPDCVLIGRLSHVGAKSLTRYALTSNKLIREGDLDACERGFRLAREYYHGAGVDRRVLEVDFDSARYVAMSEGLKSSRVVFQRIRDRATELGEEELALRCELALLKLEIIAGNQNLRPINDYFKVAERFKADFKSAGRYADALGTAYVVSTLSQSSIKQRASLKKLARRAYRTVNMTRQFNSLAKVGTPNFRPILLLLSG